MNKPDKTDWHRLWGMMISPLFERLGCEVTVEVDLSLKVQRLDMTVVTKKQPLCFDGIDSDYYQGFENLNDHNLISFKSFHEVFNMAAIEEFYGHFSNYKKIKNLEDNGNVNLYAVTHHFPRELFQRYKNTNLIYCISENRIYDLKVFTPVRFIVTNSFDHPILGLFSNKPEQIIKSKNRLEKDGWLLEHVSSYLKKLYQFYSMEGLDMPYTKEMFFRDYYPETNERFLLGEQKGLQKGLQKGKMIERIRLLQQILKLPISPEEELLEKEISELQNLCGVIEKEWNQVQN